MKYLPNLVSLLRLALSPFVLFLSYIGSHEWAALLFFLLTLSDATDGFLARRLKAQTLLGKLLDPLADKALLLTGLAATVFFTDVKVDRHLLLLLLLRDISLVIGTVLLRRFGFIPEPSISGKLTTLCISVTVVFALLLNLHPVESVLPALRGMEILSMLLVLVSWIDYALRGAAFFKSKLIMERR